MYGHLRAINVNYRPLSSYVLAQQSTATHISFSDNFIAISNNLGNISVSCSKFTPLNCVHAARCATACISVHFWYKQQLHLSPLVTDTVVLVYYDVTLLTPFNPTGRNLMVWRRVTMQTKPPLQLSISIFLNDFQLKSLLPFCQNVEVLHYGVAMSMWSNRHNDFTKTSTTTHNG
jgi:hypothetical protein